MKKENLFYLILLLTILITRISVIIVPEVDIKILNVIIHHFWFGVVLSLTGLLISKERANLKILLFGIGAGLIIDQLIFMILGAGLDVQYWALPSLLGAIVISLVVYPVRIKLTNFLLKCGN